MKVNKQLIMVSIFIIISACNKMVYDTNGETIYKTGRNQQGEKLLDKSKSTIKIVSSCKTCHVKDGNALNGISLKYNYLTNPDNFTIPYNDSLFFRFLDKDLKSNGVKANIGVIWKMSDKDKKDLIVYLKTL